MKKLYLVGALILSSGLINAAELKLKIEDAVELALERNERAEISQLQIEEANKSLKLAYSSLFPTISLEAKASKSSQNPALLGAAGAERLFSNYTEGVTVSLAQPIYTFGRLSGGIKLAKIQKKIAKDASRVTEAELVTTTKTLFNNALFYKRNLEIARDSYRNVLKNQNGLRNRVSNGRIAQGDNLKMRADLASRQPRVVEAERLFETSIRDLKSLLNLTEDTSIQLLGSLEVKPKDPSRVAEIEELLQVRLLESQYQIQSSLEEVAAADYWPTLSFFGSYGDTAFYEDFYREGHFLDQETTAFGLVLNMEFSLGKNYEHQVSKVKTRIKKLEYQEGKRQIRTALNNLYGQFDKVLEKQSALREAVRLAQNSFLIAQDSFSSGSVSQTQLNDSELLLTNNKVAYAQSLLELRLVALEIEKLETKGK